MTPIFEMWKPKLRQLCDEVGHMVGKTQTRPLLTPLLML